MQDRRGARPAEGLEDITALGDPDLRDRLSGLALDDQVELFKRSGWEDRAKIVKNSDLAGEIVAAMPDEEILLTFKGAGEETGLALIPHLSEEQLRFVLDIDLWNEHAVDDERVLKWLDYFVMSGEKTVIDFVRACDVELVVVFLSKLIRLIPFDDAVEMGGELTSIMPDEMFIVQPLIPEEASSIRLFLTTIMADDRELYSELRYSTYRAIATETEDEAYRWRNSRLEEKGILEYGEAARIYDSLPESEIQGLTGRDVRPYYGGVNDIQVPAFYPLGLSGSRPLYYELLEDLDNDEVRNRIAGDASYVTNRLLVADGQAIGDVDATRAALGRLFSFANVGLLHVAEKSGLEPAEVLEAVSISNLFRAGLGPVMALKPEADEIGRGCPLLPGFGEYALFEDYHVGALKGLRMKVPRHYEPEATSTDDYRDFKTPEEIATATAVLAQISVLAEACYDKLDILSLVSAGAAASQSAPLAASRMDFGNLLMTGFARFVLDGEFGVGPLKKTELGRFLDAAFMTGEDGDRSLDPAAGAKFVAWLKRKTGLRGHRWAILEAYVMERLEVVEEDLAGAASAKDVDALLVESILLAN